MAPMTDSTGTAWDTASLQAAMPFTALLGAELVTATPEEVVLRLAWAPDRCTAAGMLHGGALMGLADAAGGLCAYLRLPEGATTATISSTTHFLRAVREGHVEAVARPLHTGRSVIVVDTDVRDPDGRSVARITQHQVVQPAR